MMQMKDISDDEIAKVQKVSKEKMNSTETVGDNKLIKLVEQIKAGNHPIQTGEPMVSDQSKEEVSQIQPSNFSNTNYWKIEGLPSRSKFYPANCEIQGRPMKVLEIKKISSMNGDNGDFILNDIIRKTIIGIDVNDLYIADKLFLIFWLRANTYRESGYVIPFICNKCEKKSEYHFKIDNLEVQTIGEDFSPDKQLKIGKDIITYDYLKIKDELFIDRFKEINKRAIGEFDDELLSMAQMVKTMNGQEKTLLEKYQWITELTPGDFVYLKTYMEKNGMGIKPLVNIECKECGGTATIAVSFRADFFVPEFKFE